MPRQLLLLAKVVPGVDDELDAIVARLGRADDLLGLVDAHLTGRGLLHWACWYDPWLMGNDLQPDTWPYGVRGVEVAEGVWTLPLTSDWSEVRDAVGSTHQWQEQSWLIDCALNSVSRRRPLAGD